MKKSGSELSRKYLIKAFNLNRSEFMKFANATPFNVMLIF